MLILSWVPCRRNNSDKKKPRKIGSQSLAIDFGIPWSLMISLANNLATILAVYGCHSPKKCAYLVNRSTTTSIASFPWERGNPIMKFRKISSHTQVEIDNSWRRPAGETASYFCVWHTKHCHRFLYLLHHPKPVWIRGDAVVSAKGSWVPTQRRGIVFFYQFRNPPWKRWNN